MEDQKHFNLLLSSRQWEKLKAVSLDLEMSVSELTRRILDFGLSQQSLNYIVPSMSGQISVGNERKS